jgi:hypothetical protein
VTVVNSNGRCRLHGGLTPTGPALPQFKNGLHSKYAYLPDSLTARIDPLGLNVIENLEGAVQIQAALETRLHEEFNEGCSLERWREVNDIITLFEKQEAEENNPSPRECLESVSALIKQGLNESRHEELLAERLRLSHDSQRKLSESVSKIRKEMQETYTQEQWNVMNNILLNIIREELQQVDNGRTLGRIAQRIASYHRPELKQIGGRTEG